MSGADQIGSGGVARLAERVIHLWALLGGVVLMLVMLMNVVSVVGGVVWVPFPGDFELTEVGVAVAAFMFLPFCELTGANVTADIFTARASRRTIAAFRLIAALVALGVSILLVRQMSLGMLSQKEYGYVTAIVQFPVWVAFVPIVMSLALLSVAAFMSVLRAGGALGEGRRA